MSRVLRWIVVLLLLGPLTGAVSSAAKSKKPSGAGARPVAKPATTKTQPTRAGHPAPRPTLALQVGHGDDIGFIAFSPDGRTLATGSDDHTVKLWDVESGRVKATLGGPDLRVSPSRNHSSIADKILAFSRDSKTLLTASDEDEGPIYVVRLWDSATGNLKATIRSECPRFVLSPDADTLALVGSGGMIELRDASTGRLKRSLRMQTPVQSIGWFVFSPDGQTLAAFAPGDTVRLFATETGQLRTTLGEARQGGGSQSLGYGGDRTGHAPVQAFSPDGGVFAESDSEPGSEGFRARLVRLWDVRSGKLKATLRGHTENVYALAFSTDGKLLVTGGGKHERTPDDQEIGVGEVIMWNATTGRHQKNLDGHRYTVFSATFSIDGKTLITRSQDSIRLWDTLNGQPVSFENREASRGSATKVEELISRVDGGAYSVFAVAHSPSGNTMATAHSDGSVGIWDTSNWQLRSIAKQHTLSAEALAFSPDGQTIASGSRDTTIVLCNSPGGQRKRTLHGQRTSTFTTALSPDGRIIAAGSSEKNISRPGELRLWDVASGELKSAFKQASGVLSLAFAPDGRTLAFCEWNGSIGVWDDTTGLSKRHSLKVEHPQLVAFLPKHRVVAIRTYVYERYDRGDYELSLWDPESGSVRSSQHGNTFAISPDGAMLASADKNGKIHLQTTSSGTLLATLNADSEQNHLLFSRDGRMLATHGVYSPGKSFLWDVSAGRLISRLEQSSYPIDFSADGQLLACGGFNNVQLWDTRTGKQKFVLPKHKHLQSLSFSRDGRSIATLDSDHKVRLWDAANGKPISLTSLAQLGGYPAPFSRPFSYAGAAISVHDPLDGRVLATMLPVPEAAGENEKSNEWFVTTPEGYFDCSSNAARFVLWNVNGELYPAERYLRRFRRPDLVRKALRGEKIVAPAISASDIPPAVRFVTPKRGDAVQGATMSVTVEGLDDRIVKEVELFVNGRPVPAQPVATSAKPIAVGAKDLDPHHRKSQRFSFNVPIPRGASEIRLGALAYDDTDLGSELAEIIVRCLDARPVAGDLYLLSIGASRYKNADGVRLKNLRYPTIDARAIAERFQREARTGSQSVGSGLYEKVHTRLLVDEQASLAGIRAAFKWLQTSARPGQIDTVVVFLSGHGYSVDGKYFYAPHDFDVRDASRTGLSARELSTALGAQLSARAVFLFADTCHSGGLSARNDDLAVEVEKSVYVLASSGAREYSFESEQWGHGAFTLSLLKALNRTDLAREGVITFNALAYAVPEGVADLMKAAGRNENEQEPCIPLAARRLRVPIAQAVR